MTDREKLIKLVHKAIAEWEHGEVDEKIADYLIANGVTVQSKQGNAHHEPFEEDESDGLYD